LPQTDLLILGAGITGLVAAQRARQQQIDHVVLDQAYHAGGVLQSAQRDGYTLDFGANSLALTPELRRLIQELNLDHALCEALPAGNKRYLFRHGRLHPVEPSASTLLRTKLLSPAGKLRLLMEPLIPARRNGAEETVAAFFQRRIGKEGFRYLIEPVLTGIYAGDAERMSVEAVLPQMVSWERDHGSLLRGLQQMQKARRGSSAPGRQIVSFEGGMATLIEALVQALGDRLHLRTRVLRILPHHEGGFAVEVEKAGRLQLWQARAVVWTLPAQAAPALLPLDQSLPLDVQAIPYPPMLMYSLGYHRKAVGRELDSFGFLVPTATQQPLLGAIWNSTIFPDKAPAGQALFTLFVGGAKHMGAREQVLLDQAQQARRVFERVMRIDGPPTFASHYFWPKAIPQYHLGHRALVDRVRALEARWPGLLVSANWLDGVSVGDRVKGGWGIMERLDRQQWQGLLTVLD
jgi:protoporphyrinogen/coproporphyrinogen III oxidase